MSLFLLLLGLLALLSQLPLSACEPKISSPAPAKTTSSLESIQQSSSPGPGAVAVGPNKDSTKPKSSIRFTRRSYEATIPENALGKVYATPSTKMGVALAANSTLEFGRDYVIRFRIKSGDPEGFFKAEAERVGDFVFLVLRTRTSNLNVLNRERTASYKLEVRARVKRRSKDARKKKERLPDARTTVNVRVVDANDLDPFFAPSSYSFDVDEDTPLHAPIGRVNADDADSGINGEIYYSILRERPTEDPDTFAVDPVSGILSLTRPLSFKDKPTHELTLLAQDRGPKASYYSNRQADTAVVKVNVKQVRKTDSREQFLDGSPISIFTF